MDELRLSTRRDGMLVYSMGTSQSLSAAFETARDWAAALDRTVYLSFGDGLLYPVAGRDAPGGFQNGMIARRYGAFAPARS